MHYMWVVGSGVAALGLRLGVAIFRRLRPHIPNTCENAGYLRIDCIVTRIMLEVFNALYGARKYSAMRRFFKYWSSPSSGDSDVAIAQVKTDTFALRIYTPCDMEKVQNNSAIFYIHGGGYVIGECVEYDYVLKYLAMKVGCVIIGVDYRCAPEYPYPIPNDDVSDAYDYMMTNASTFRINPKKVVCFGDSAGGHACLVLNTRLNLANKPNLPLAQVLIYPAAQWYTYNTPSFQTYRNCGDLSPAEAGSIVCAYLGVDTGDVDLIMNDCHVTEDVRQKHGLSCLSSAISKPICYSPVDGVPLHIKYARLHENTEISPLFSDTLHRQPFTIIVTASYDEYRYDGKMMIEKLASVGVRTKYLEVQSIHGFLSYFYYHDPAYNAFHEIINDIKEIFGTDKL